MTLGTTREGDTVEMERVRGSSWTLKVGGERYGPLQSFVACVVVSHQLIPVVRRVV